MQPNITTDIKKPRKTQIFKWTLNKDANLYCTDKLARFFSLLGFGATDTISCQLRHETLGYFLEGQLSLGKLQQQGLGALSTLCKTNSLGMITKYIRTENENGFGVFYAILGSRRDADTQEQQVRFHVVDYDTGKQREKCATEEDALQLASAWESQGTFSKVQVQAPNQLQKDYVVLGYYTQAHIQQLKQEFLKRYENDLATAIIVDTYNGFHIYFRVENADITRFSEIQFALARKFGGDTSITDHARILRVPYFFHVKNPQNPYFVEVIQWGLTRQDGSQVIHTQDGLVRVLDLETSEYHSEKITIKSKVDGIAKTRSKVTTLLPQKTVNATFYEVDGKPTKSLSFLDFLEQVKQLPIETFFANYEFALHKGQSFQCLFHNDTNPSATLYQTANGVEQYKCFSPTCEASAWTVVDLTMHMLEVGVIDTVQYLSGLAGVEIIQTKFQQDTLNTLHHNFTWIKRNLECKNVLLSEKPFLYKFFTRSMKKLAKELMVQLLSYPIQERWSLDGQPIFFASAEYLAKECHISRKVTQQNLDLLVLIGFFQKLPHHLVPKSLFRRNSAMNVVNYYTVGAFEEAALTAETLVGDLQALKFRKKEIGFDYIVATFGVEEAQRVYPNQYQQTIKQPKSGKPNEVKEYTQIAFDASLIYTKKTISKKGYLKETFLHKHLQQAFEQTNSQMPTRKWQATLERAHMYLQSKGYERRSLTKAVAKEVGLKQAQTKAQRIYIWTKKD